MDAPVVVAFPGGLEAEYLLASLARDRRPVVTLSVDTGRLEEGELERLGRRARALGARRHLAHERRQEVFDRWVAPLIRANVLVNGVDPLWTLAEDCCWAAELAAAAKETRAEAVAHAAFSPAENLRVEAALQALLPELELLDPIRDELSSAAEQRAYLEELGLDPEGEPAGTYRTLGGLWGTRSRGGELEDPWEAPDEEAHPGMAPPWEAAELPEEFDLGFRAGLPVQAFGQELDGASLVAQLNRLGRRHAIGRTLHLARGPAGLLERVALEAPAAHLIVPAHRALERLVLSEAQLAVQDELAARYVDHFRRGLVHEPLLRDIERFFASSQERVEGTVRLQVYRGQALPIGLSSPHSLHAAAGGEPTRLFDGRDVEGYVRIAALSGQLAGRRTARQRPETEDA